MNRLVIRTGIICEVVAGGAGIWWRWRTNFLDITLFNSLWFIWLRTGVERQLVDLAFRCRGNKLRLFDVQGVGGLTSLWMVDEGRRVVCFGIEISEKDLFYISLSEIGCEFD